MEPESDPYKIPIKDHLAKEELKLCGYCGQPFEPDENVIEKVIHGQRWHFCSDRCYNDFLDAIDFKDEDLDSYGVEVVLKEEE